MSSVVVVNLKLAVLGSLVLSAAVAFGQIKPAEQPIQQGFTTLRGHAGLTLTLDGTQKIGTDPATTFKTVTYWFQDVESGRPMAKVEMLGYVNGSATFLLVGDGVTLWAYDMVRNEYSTSRYGAFNGAQPADYVNALLNTMRSMIKGQAAYPVRLLSETYAGENARYTTWVPGTAIVNTGTDIQYSLGNPVWRRMDFSYNYVAPYMNITQIAYFDEVYFANQARDINWTLTPLSSDTAPAGSNFSFVPPNSARAVTGVRPVTGC